MPFRVFRILFPGLMMVELNAIIKKSKVPETYNQSNIEQFGRCAIKIKHNDKCVKCRFFVVLGDGPALLKMPDKELHNIIRVMCNTIDNKTNSKKFYSPTRHVADS